MMHDAIQRMRPENTRPTLPLLLAALPEQDRKLAFAALQRVELHRGAIIADPGRPVQYGYFVESGIISLQVTTHQGRSVETAMIGREGFWDLLLLAASGTPPLQAVVQVPGEALRITRDELLRVTQQSSVLQGVFLQYAAYRIAEAGQLAACNAMHEVEARLARWLLMIQDKAESQEAVAVTHECMGQMLGTNRATISLSAEAMKRAGLITYGRGRVQIANRTGLQSVACDCYEVLSGLLASYRTALLRWSHGEENSRLPYASPLPVRQREKEDKRAQSSFLPDLRTG